MYLASQNFIAPGLFSYLLTIGGFLLAVFAIARLINEKRQPSNTIAWLLIIILLPYVGVPLFLLVGGRKIKRIAKSKHMPMLEVPGVKAPSGKTCTFPTVHAITSAGAPEPVGGNRIRLITNGEQAFKEIETLIISAKSSIHITTFILGRDKTAKRIVRLLARRARQGIKVRLLLDYLGCLFITKHHISRILKAGGEVVRFMPMVPLSPRGSANLRNHRKIIIVDQSSAIIGGHNIADEYIGPTYKKTRWADFGLIIRGPGASMLNQVFLSDWAFASGQSLGKLQEEFDPRSITSKGNGDLQVIPSGPDINGDPLYEGILSMIQESEQSIWIITPYFIPDEVLLRSLIVKARAGKDVTLILPKRSNHPITDYARRDFLRKLSDAGARIMYYTKGMMHTKAVIIDERIALAGSANFDIRSLFVNFEIGVMLYSEADVHEMRIWAGDLINHCEPADQTQLRKRVFFSSIAEDISHLLAPLL